MRDSYILGISCFYHDAAAALIRNDKIVAAVQEERFTRKKHDASFPIHAIRYCLSEAVISIDQLDAVVFYDKPLLKFERLLVTYYQYAPKGLLSFVKAMPVWLRQKLFLKREIRNGLLEIESFDLKKLKLLFTEHHLSHAASSFYPSPFPEAAILTLDGVGEWCTTSIAVGDDRGIAILRELHFPDSIGLLYSAFTYYLGFKVNSGEYKLMGLAPFGNKSSESYRRFKEMILSTLVQVQEDGSILLNMRYFDFAVGLKMIREKKWKQLFGLPVRQPDEELNQEYCDLALAIQHVTEDIVMKIALEVKRLTSQDYLCLSGGVALNCVINGIIRRKKIFKDIYIQPAAGDAGGALGAALSARHQYFGSKRVNHSEIDMMEGSYLGPLATTAEIRSIIHQYNAIGEEVMDDHELNNRVVEQLVAGKVIGWYQGRMEFGPRALGNRSILGDPRNPEMQKKINLKIKFREGFRPFAPSVLEEDKELYFDMATPSPYMLAVHPLKGSQLVDPPEGYESWDIKKKLECPRSHLQSVTHVDLSARVQTVNSKSNPKYWALIKEFKAQTSCSVLINTSFNVRGEPIVCSAEDAYTCFMRTEMDFLVINNFLFEKQVQPRWDDNEKWKTEFTLD